MEYLFRRFPMSNPPPPAPGELHLRPRSADSPAGRKLAMLALDHGQGAFVCGEGPTERLVLQADPTLDDMLAAAFVERLLAGQKLPAGAEAFATYAANVREGLVTTALPPKDALEAIYLAIRNDAGDLDKSEDNSIQFLKDWSRMANLILAAAEKGQDPKTTPLFAADSYFDRARTYLDGDRDVYYQQDVCQGERWLVRIPEGSDLQVPGLLLKHTPRSLLWKFWSRTDPEAPGGKGYVFLGAFEKEKQWVFSTNPVHRLPIESLAEELRKAEMAKKPDQAGDNPWYDGRRHGHTLVAAPHGGTALADDEVVCIVKRWTHALPIRSGPKWKAGAVAARVLLLRRTPAAMAATVVLLLIAGASLLGLWGWAQSLFAESDEPVPKRGVTQSLESEAKTRGLERIREAEMVSGRKGKDYALLIATDHYKEWSPLSNPILDATTIKQELEESYRFRVELVKDPTLPQVFASFRKYNQMKFSDDDQLFIFIAGHGTFDEETKEGFLVARDSRRQDTDHLSYCPHSRLRDRIESIPCKHIFVVLDVCFGGTFDNFMAHADSRGGDIYRGASTKQFIRQKMKWKTRKYLTSGGKQYVPDGRPGHHSPFSRKFIAALRNRGNSNGVLTVAWILQHVETVSPQPRAGEFGSNEPGSDFLFVAKSAAPAKHEP